MSPLDTLRFTRCLLVEDHAVTADFLSEALQLAYPSLAICHARSLTEARHLMESDHTYSFGLVDLGLPDGSGIGLIAELKRKNVPAIAVTIFAEDSYLFDALSAGAFGYLLKDESPSFLVDALKRLERNEPPISPSIARRLLHHFQRPEASGEPTRSLTPRERQTLTLLVRGLTVGEAAGHMGLSAQTVSGYVKVIYQKLHVGNRAEATREAIRLGLV